MKKLDLSTLSPEQVEAVRKLSNITDFYIEKLNELIVYLKEENHDTREMIDTLKGIAANHTGQLITTKRLLK